MWNLKYDTNEPTYGTETDSQTKTIDLWLPEWGGLGEGWNGSLGLAVVSYYILYMEWINKILLYNTENYTQYPMKNHNEKEYIYIHII